MPKNDNESRIPTTPALRRGYHSPTRQRQAEETRQRMLAAARVLLARLGYVGRLTQVLNEDEIEMRRHVAPLRSAP
jgi:hypothetical protein